MGLNEGQKPRLTGRAALLAAMGLSLAACSTKPEAPASKTPAAVTAAPEPVRTSLDLQLWRDGREQRDNLEVLIPYLQETASADLLMAQSNKQILDGRLGISDQGGTEEENKDFAAVVAGTKALSDKYESELLYRINPYRIPPTSELRKGSLGYTYEFLTKEIDIALLGLGSELSATVGNTWITAEQFAAWEKAQDEVVDGPETDEAGNPLERNPLEIELDTIIAGADRDLESIDRAYARTVIAEAPTIVEGMGKGNEAKDYEALVQAVERTRGRQIARSQARLQILREEQKKLDRSKAGILKQAETAADLTFLQSMLSRISETHEAIDGEIFANDADGATLQQVADRDKARIVAERKAFFENLAAETHQLPTPQSIENGDPIVR